VFKSILISVGICCAAALGLAACDPAPVPVATVQDLINDPVILDGLLIKCAKDQRAQKTDVECTNARIAVDRIAAHREKLEAEKRIAAFERNRERLRLQQEAQRHQLEEANKIDPYKLPLIPPGPPVDNVAQNSANN
jgi:hypothetical protein